MDKTRSITLALLICALLSPSARARYGATIQNDVTGDPLLDPNFFFRPQAYPAERLPSSRRAERVAIIGAGASGLAAAHFLKQKGYRNVTVFEKETRPGGKVSSVTIDGQIYELGAVFATDTCATVLELANAYGVSYVTDPCPIRVESAPHRVHTFPQALTIDGRALQLPFNMFALKAVLLRFGQAIKTAGFDHLHPDLHLDFDSFSEKYGITLIRDIYAPIWVGCGYGYFNEVPAMYVLKLMLPGLASSLANSMKHMSFERWQDGVYRFPAGYSRMFERIASGLPDVRLGSEVTSIRRVENGAGRYAIRVTTTGGRTDEYDRLIVSIDPRAALRILDASPIEKQLFSNVRGVTYNSHLIKMDKPRHQLGSMVSFAHNTGSNTAGHVVWISNRHSNSSLWNVYQIAPPSFDSKEAERRLNRDLNDLDGSANHPIVAKVAWDYFPHVSTDALRSGFYENLLNLQGDKGTYYIGGLMNLETVEGATAFAKDMVMRRF